MKKDKKHIGLVLIECLGELLLTLLCLVIGIFIASLFGVNFEASDMDYDLVILLGVVSFFVVFGIVSACVQWLKKISRGKIHNMKLNPSPFGQIKSGEKTIELRLLDEKRQKIKEGDVIIFTNTENGETLSATVRKLHYFDSFEELYKSLPLLQCGYTAEDIGTAHPSDMEQYYTPEQQAQYGVVGIELK